MLSTLSPLRFLAYACHRWLLTEGLCISPRSGLLIGFSLFKRRCLDGYRASPKVVTGNEPENGRGGALGGRWD